MRCIESSPTLREVKDSYGKYNVTILSTINLINSQLDRIKELEDALQSYVNAYDENPHLGPRGSQVDQAFTKAMSALNKESRK